MSRQPLIFLSFANDFQGRFLLALEPERRALRQEFAIFQRNGWGYYHSASSSAPEHLLEDLQLYPRQISIFHFSGHSDGEHLQLERPDGEAVQLHRDNISAILREEAQAQLKLVVLNACRTSELIDTFQKTGVPAIIATQANIPDNLAMAFSLAFYRSLLNGNTLETAFHQAKSILEPDNPEKRIFRFNTRSFVREEVKNFDWGLYCLNEDILSWRLLEGKASDPKSQTKALNKIPGLHQDFVGRDKELRELRHMIQKEKPVLLLNGIGGIGKTTLARQYLHDNYFHFDNIVWISVLSEQGKEDKAYQTATDAFGNDIVLMDKLGIVFDKEQSVVDRAKDILKSLRSQTGKNLLVIDNAGFSLEEIRKVLPKPPNWQVLITSRKELPGLSVKRLDELPPAEALELFNLHYPQGKYEAEDVETLLGHIGNHTLTLELFAKTCQKSPSTNPGKILKLLQEKRLENLSRKVFVEHSDEEVEVYGYLLTAFELHELTEVELGVLIQWAILPPQEINWELLCEIYWIPKEGLGEFEDALIGLQEKGWIEKGRAGQSYRMHQLIQEVIQYKHEPNGDNCKKVIKGIEGLLSIDQSKDNPIDKFEFVPFGESILAAFKGVINETANLQNNLGLVYKDKGEYKRASILLEVALSSALQCFGKDHPITSINRSNLALVYKDLGEYRTAANLMELALSSDIKTFGENHPSAARRRSNLASIYKALGEYEKATSLLEIALSSNINSFGENHPETNIRRSNLASAYNVLGEHEKAKGLLKQVLSFSIQRFGENHPTTSVRRSNLALVYKDLREYEKARGLLEKALISDLKNFGEDHPTTSIRRSNLALVYKDLGEYEKAVSLLKVALSATLKSFGENHPSTARRRLNLATVYLKESKPKEAKLLLEKAYSTYLIKLGAEHRLTKNCKSWLDRVNKQI